MEQKSMPDRFMDFEREMALFSLQIDGVFFWKLVRSRVYNNILKKLGLLSESSYTVARGGWSKIKDFLRYCAVAFANMLTPFPKADILVINHPRKVLVNGEYKDTNTDWLVEKLSKENANYLVLDMPLNWSSHPMTIGSNTRRIENFTILFKVFYKYFAHNRLNKNATLKKVSEILKECFGTDGSILKETHDQINIFKVEYRYYLRLLRRIKPRKVWVVIGYAHHALIEVARELGIETEEIQHGLMSKHHMNYGFNGLKNAPYFPDRMCLFGRFWYDIAKLPLPEDKLDFYQNPIRKYKPGNVREPRNNKIMFLTQPIITKYITDFIDQMIESGLFEEYEIIVKLHPSEYRVWREQHPKLERLSEKRNITVVDSFNIPLYELFQSVDTIVAVASTSLFEALYFGCYVYLLSVSAIEWISSLGDMFPPPIKTPEDLACLMDNPYRNRFRVDDIFFGG